MKSPGLNTMARGLLALVAIISLIVMVPLLLIAMIGNPVPQPWSWNQPLTDQAVLGVLACLAWLLWAQFAACVAIEVIAEVRLAAGRSGDWLSRAPGTWRGQQAFARTLVQAVVAIGVTSSAMMIAPAWTSHADATTVHWPDVSQHDASDPERLHQTVEPAGASKQVSTATVEVRRGDTLWSIAEAHLGAGERWREIAALNDQRVMADGQRFVDADRIRPGWVLLIPRTARAPRAGVVTVEPGDNLWRIAEDEYGVGADWPEIFHANRTQIDDPNRIYPGQQLTVPGPSDNSTVRTPHQPEPAPGDQRARDPDERSEPGQTPPAEPGTPRPPSGTPHETESRRHEGQVSDRSQSAGESWLYGTLARTLAGGGTLLAGCLAAAYMARRHAQFRMRTSGRTIPRTSSELVPVERDIRSAGLAGGDAVDFLDRALRELGSVASVLPDVAAARLSDDSLELVLRHPLVTAPAPWLVVDEGRRWRLPRTHGTAESTGPAPYPTLVTLGVDSHGATWLVDLEAAGRVQLQGPDEVCDDVIRFITAELATNRWSDVVKVKVAGIEPGLLHLNPGRLELMQRADLDHAREKARRVMAAQREADLDVLAGRQKVDSGDMWNPLLVLAAASSSPDESAVARLMQARGGFRCATAVVLGGEAVLDGLNISVDGGGCAAIPWAGRIELNRLSADDARAIGAAFADVERLDDEPMPVGPLAGSGPVAGLADEAGALHPEHTRPRTEGGSSESMLPEPDSVYLGAAATTHEDLGILAPMVRQPVEEAVTAADPHLDDDLDEWLDGAVVRPQLRLLGPIELRVDRPIPEVARGRVAYLTEVAAYLLCHSGGVTSTGLADVFGVQANTIHKRIQELRDWLGVDPSTGVQRLPEAKLSEPGTARGIGNYVLTGILADVDLFRRLRVRGQARGADGIDDLIAALGLVTGRPFDQQRAHGYGWLAADATDHHLTAGIVDVAHIVATSKLAAGDGERAAWAATTARHVAPFEDKPHLDYAAALEAMGHVAEAKEYLDREVLNRSDDDLAPPDPTPRVGQLVSRRGPGRVGPQSRSRSDGQ